MANPIRHLALAAALASSLVVNAANAQAQDAVSGAYASISGLYLVPTDSDWSSTGEGATYATEIEWGAGFGLLLAYGFGADSGLRGEVEVGYRKSDADKLKGFSEESDGVAISFDDIEFGVDGDMTTLSLMGNGIYAFEAGSLRPYVGAGIGLARHDATIKLETVSVGGEVVDSREFGLEDAPEASDDDVVLAYQVMAGVGFAMSEGTEVRLGYRYFATADADFEGDEVSFASHNFEAGILIRF